MTVVAVNYFHDILGLVRWLHVFAAIIWIGTTAFFWVLESSLRKPDGPPVDDFGGEFEERYWLHGGIYAFRGFKSPPARLPRDVHFASEWYAYTTWLTGFGLLIIAYYWNPGAYLVDRSVADISGATAVLISIGVVFVSVALYEVLCRELVDHENQLRWVLGALVIALAYGLSHVFAPRGVVIQTGAVLGTWMAGSVLFVWRPMHRAIYRAKVADEGTVDPLYWKLSWQRAQHNAYLAPAVVLAMLGSHFSFILTARDAWLALIGFMCVGALLRYFFIWRQRGAIWRQRGRKAWAAPILGLGLIIALLVWLAPSGDTSVPAQTQAGGRSPTDATAPARLSEGRKLFTDTGCASCHTLTDAGSSGTVGPRLDGLGLTPDRVASMIRGGGGAMPSFADKLSTDQISELADYVATVSR